MKAKNVEMNCQVKRNECRASGNKNRVSVNENRGNTKEKKTIMVDNVQIQTKMEGIELQVQN